MMKTRLGDKFDIAEVPFHEEKPIGNAWSSFQVIDYMEKMLKQDKFYIFCPDNDYSVEQIKKEIQWTADDMIKDRPPLSRHHPDYTDPFQPLRAQMTDEQKRTISTNLL